MAWGLAPASAAPYGSGDVFVSVTPGQVVEYTPAGAVVQTLTTGQDVETGSTFDSAGNFYVTNFDARTISRFDPSGTLAGTFGTGQFNPESIVVDAAGDLLVGDAGQGVITRYDATGTRTGTWSVAIEDRGTDWIDLEGDQCTVRYTSEGRDVMQYDICTSTQLDPFALDLPGSAAYALRILPDGGALVADTEQIVRLDSTGNVVQTYDAPDHDGWFALNLANDGTSFYSADYTTDDVYRFDIASGGTLSHFNAGPGFTVFGLSVNGEETAGRNDPPFVDAGPDGSGTTGTPIALDGTVSDPENDPLTVTWSVPAGTPCTFADPHAVDTTVTCTSPGIYTVTLTADDGHNPPVSDTADVVVEESGGGGDHSTCLGLSPTPGTTVQGGVITGTPGDDVILGTEGDDVIKGRGGHDVICGFGGNDRIYGNGTNDRLMGGKGDDSLIGDGRNDFLIGGPGNDHIVGGNGPDRIVAGSGNDYVNGNAGNDRVSGERGNDTVVGGSGDDLIWGGPGNDLLRGSAGADTLNGGADADTCTDPQGMTFVNCETTRNR